jgi:hypothetical protein
MLHRFRQNYWSCSSFANRIRGTEKPYALEWKAWEKWRIKAQARHPYRYWVAETLLDFLQDMLMLPIDIYRTIKIYICNRFIDKTHYIKTGLKPGDYHEFDKKVLHGLFNELVDFVEIELAHLMISDRKKRYKFKNHRCVEASYDYFNWATNLTYNEEYGILPNDPDYGTLTDQAVSTIKIKNLYEWWKVERPNRIDPFAIITEKTHGERYYRLINEMEREYEHKDTEKLIELIKIRASIWT